MVKYTVAVLICRGFSKPGVARAKHDHSTMWYTILLYYNAYAFASAITPQALN